MQPLLVLLYGVSGFCLLSMETIWIREVGLRNGNTVMSASWVIAIFFLFAGLGNLLGGKLSARFLRPLIGYGLAELLAAVACLLTYLCRDPLYGIVAGAGSLEYAYALLLAAPASFASGAGLPFLTEAFVDANRKRTSKGGTLYAANLIGAACGVIVGGISMPSRYGYSRTVLVVCIVLALVGGVALALNRVIAAPAQGSSTQQGEQSSTPFPAILGMVILIASGVLSLVLEVLCLKYFMILVHASVYAVSAVFCAFIINLGIGAGFAALLRRFGVSTWKALAACMAGGCVVIAAYPLLFQNLIETGALGEAMMPGKLLNETVSLAWIVLFPGLLCIGAVFPLAWEVVSTELRQGKAFGRIFALNKLGSAVGIFAAPYLLLPVFGLTGAFAAVAVIYASLALGSCIVATSHKLFRAGLAALLLVGLAGTGVFYDPPVKLADGTKLLALYTGRGPVTTVVEDQVGSRHIMLDNSYMLNGTARSMRTQQHESWLPLALHPAPQDVTFVGMASGISADAALDFPIRRLTAVEIVPEVVRAAEAHFADWNQRLFTAARATIVTDDGRHVVATGPPQDIIICDLFNPSREGVSNMYSVDFFQTARGKLKPNGLACIWLASYQMNSEIAGSIIRSFLSVFPNVILIRANFDPLQPAIGLVGSNETFDLSDSTIRSRLEKAPDVSQHSPFLWSVANFRLVLVGDLRWIADDFASFPLNTDDRPYIEFNGGRAVGQGKRLRGLNLLNWIGKQFTKAQFPSCRLGTTEESELIGGIRAGNHLYAASVMLVEIPGDARKQMKRQLMAMDHLRKARSMIEGLQIEDDHLGH